MKMIKDSSKKTNKTRELDKKLMVGEPTHADASHPSSSEVCLRSKRLGPKQVHNPHSLLCTFRAKTDRSHSAKTTKREREMGSSKNSFFTIPYWFIVHFTFNPPDEELLTDYLEKKNRGEDSENINMIPEITLCNQEPREIPGLVCARAKSLGKEWFTEGNNRHKKWYFFGRPDPKYSNSKLSNRTTREGNWKPTCKEREIKAPSSNTVIGRRRIMTFYERTGPKAKKITNWVIHEYYLTQAQSDDQIGDFVLCCLKKNSDHHDKEDSPICSEAETGRGIVENQAAETGIPNKDECSGSLTDSCAAEKDPSNSIEDQPDSCISPERIDERDDESGTLISIFNPPQPHQLPQLHQTSQPYQPQVYSPSTVQSPTSTKTCMVTEAATGIGGSSTVENQSVQTCMITEAEENLAFEALVDSLRMRDDESGTLISIFNPPQPHQLPQLRQPSQTYQPQVHSPSTVQSPSTKLGNVSHTNNVNYGKCQKRKCTFGDNTYSPKKKNIITNDHGNAESCCENQAANYRIPEGYPQPGTNLGSLPIRQQDSDYTPPSINREPRDISHVNDYIEWDDLPSLVGDI